MYFAKQKTVQIIEYFLSHHFWYKSNVKMWVKYLDEFFLSFSHWEPASNKYFQTGFLKRAEYSKTTKTKSV